MTAGARARGPVLLVAGAAAAFLAVYLYLLRDVGPANDEWTFLLYRPFGFHGVLDEYNAQPIVTEVLLYQGWAELFGPAHRLPLLLLYAAALIGVAALVFALARRRVGDWPAAGVAVLVLFLGRAWETLLTPGSLTFVLPTLAAVLAWQALDGGVRPAALAVAAGALAAASLCGGLIVAILAGLGAEAALARRARALWLLAAGAVPLGAWYVVKLASTPVAVGAGVSEVDVGESLGELPVWALKFLAAGAGATLGLPPAAGAGVLVAVALAAGLLALRGRLVLTPRAAGLTVTLAATVLATGLARAATTPPTSSRYLYFPAVVLLLLACELARDVPRPASRVAAVAGALAVTVAVVLGVQELRDGKPFYRRSGDGTAARMGALRLVDGRLPPDFAVIEPSRLAYTPREVDELVGRFGAGALHGPDELAGALPESREAADVLLAAALVRPAAGRPTRCRPASGDTLPRRGLVRLDAPRPVQARLRAFAEVPGAVPIPLRAATPVVLRADSTPLPRPWRLTVPNATARICAQTTAPTS